ncbi:MAG: lipoprotein signal peptidase [Bacteroidetes bacterium]|nr:MAG: lipoprotein signal peptidase [Bacteroidota bacterium]
MQQARKYFLLSAGVVVLDQITKLIVKLNMSLGDEIRVLGDLFKIHFIENKGAAFGLTISRMANAMGIHMSDETGKLILSLFSIAAVIAIGVVLFRLAGHRSLLPWFIALIFGGALGNIIDRTFYGLFFSDINAYTGGLFHGRVVDMFYLDIWKGQLPDWIPLFGRSYTSLWPIFNIADSAISVGIVVILIFQGRFFKQDERARAAEASASEADFPATTSEKAEEKPAEA